MSNGLNILLLGSTGVGKSTFINSIANYFTYNSFEEAIKNEPEVIVPTKFTVAITVDSEITPLEIVMKPDGDPQNYDQEQLDYLGDSATQRPTIYKFQHEKQVINIVDVPGIADTRGIDKDSQNIQQIFDVVGPLGELHLICIMLKSNDSRLTTEYTYGLNELLLHLHKKAVSNIVFVFTNTRATEFTPGEGLITLKKYIKHLENKGTNIELNKDTLYCVDSEPFRIQCFWKLHPDKHVKQDEIKYTDCWKKSSTAVKKIIEHARHLEKVYQTVNTMSINEARCSILFLLEPLSMVSALLTSCRLNMTFESICEQLINGRVIGRDLEIVKQAEFNTICNSPKCIGKYQVCHKNCGLLEIGINSPRDPRLKDCAAFENDDEENPTCYECGCAFEFHQRVMYSVKIGKTENMSNFVKEVYNRFIEHEITEVEATKTIIDELEYEKNEINNALTVFGKFLKENAILTYNNAYEERLKVEIRIAEHENQYALASELRENLRKFIDERKKLDIYVKEEEKKKSFLGGISQKLENKLHSKKKEVSSEIVHEISENLMKMKLFGGKIKELYEMQITMAEKDLRPYTVKFQTKSNLPK